MSGVTQRTRIGYRGPLPRLSVVVAAQLPPVSISGAMTTAAAAAAAAVYGFVVSYPTLGAIHPRRSLLTSLKLMSSVTSASPLSWSSTDSCLTSPLGTNPGGDAVARDAGTLLLRFRHSAVIRKIRVSIFWAFAVAAWYQPTMYKTRKSKSGPFSSS